MVHVILVFKMGPHQHVSTSKFAPILSLSPLCGLTGPSPNRLDTIPHFNSSENRSIIQQMMGPTREKQFLIENMGKFILKEWVLRCCLTSKVGLTPQDVSSEVFNKDGVKRMFTNPRVTCPPYLRYIFIAVDPCAGTKDPTKRASDWTVVTLSSPMNIILGMEAIDVVKPEDYQERFLEHIRRVRALPGCATARIVIDVESGSALEAGHIYKLVRDNFNDVVTMNDDGRIPGTRMTEQTKGEMTTLAVRAIDDGHIAFHRQLVTTHAAPRDMLDEFQKQLLNFKREIRQSKNGTVHYIYSGKDSGRDDMTIAFMRCLYARYRFEREPKYARYMM
jgi:hypothetical protein